MRLKLFWSRALRLQGLHTLRTSVILSPRWLSLSITFGNSRVSSQKFVNLLCMHWSYFSSPIRLIDLLSVGIGLFLFSPRRICTLVGFQFRRHVAIANIHLQSGCAFKVGKTGHIFCDLFVLRLILFLLCMDNVLELKVPGSGRCGPNMRTDVAGAVEYDWISFKADQQGYEGCTLSPL